MKTNQKIKIFEFNQFYKTKFEKDDETKIIEKPERYIIFKVYKEKEYLKTTTSYKCPFCGFKKHNDQQCEKEETKKEITFTKKCEKCKKTIVKKTFKKEEI